MPNKRKSSTPEIDKKDIPETLDDSLFFGLQLTDEQKEYRDAIYSKDYDIVFCNSPSGTGKTTVAVATAKIMVEQGRYDRLVYVVSPTQEQKQGFLKGDINEKTLPYSQPLVDALIEVGDQPEKVIRQYNIDNQKNGTAWVDCVSHTFFRGMNLKNCICIVDEMQNAYVDECKKILTRPCKSSKIVCIGHGGQKDIVKNPERSGFEIYIKWFEKKDRCKICRLTKNFRLWVSQWADELTEKDINNIIKEIY